MGRQRRGEVVGIGTVVELAGVVVVVVVVVGRGEWV